MKEDMELLVNSTRAAFLTGRTKTEAFRKDQLRALKRLVSENESEFVEALKKDLGKCRAEALLFETDILETDIEHALKNVSSWMKPEYVSKTLLYKPMSCYIHKDPYGVTLIIGAWNYPVQLTFLPLVGAIAAGNCAVLKPSEMAPATATLIEKLVPKYLDEECFKVVTGGIPETTALLEQKFDKIFYTGSSPVGKIVMTAAAKHLTPVVLELGGKSPVYVADDADLTITANRLAWAKLVNCGQTCIAPDYVLCSKEMQEKLKNQLKEVINGFYSDEASTSPDYGKIVNERHFERVESFLTDEGVEIFYGGQRDKSKLFISPTIITNAKESQKCMQEEIFGPVLPIMPVDSLHEAINFVQIRPKPLSLYVFTNAKSTIETWRNATTCGMFVANDAMLQGGLPYLPFGGVGESGTGCYHGKFSFDAFSHGKSCMEVPTRMVEGANHRFRYPPYTDSKLSWARWVLSGKEGFSCNVL